MTLTVAGLSGFGRSCAALVKDGVLRASAAEEIFSRRKNDPALPAQAFRWICAQAGSEPGSLDFVAFAEKPVQRFVRVLGGLAQGFPFTLRSFPRSLTTWLGDRLWLKTSLMKSLAVDPNRLLFVERPLAQCAAAFFTSGFADAAILTVDGVGEWAATMLCRGQGTNIEPMAEIQHPHSLAFFLDAVGHHLLVPETGGLCWLAALASRGEPRLAKAMEEIVRPCSDGAYELDPRSFDLSAGTPRFTARARRILGQPRGSGQDAQAWVDVASSAQSLVVDRVLALCREAKRRTGCSKLCLSGSVFQDPDIVARVLADSEFEHVHVDPFLGDAAAALGAALWVTHVVHKVEPQKFDFRAQECALPQMPSGAGWSVQSGSADSASAAAVSALQAGKIVALVAGRTEFGSRPRGSRVLLADPTRADTTATLRNKVKLSEPYVPTALCGLAEDLVGWAETKTSEVTARAQCTLALPAGCAEAGNGDVQIGGKALLQAVDPATQPLLARILREFRATGSHVPLLAQTSLNRAGDPPVQEPLEAVDLLRRSEIEVLVWGDQVVRRA